MDKLLNYKIQGNGEPLLLVHGLFGSLDNLGLLARGLQERYQVISVDLRNHGRSFHSKDHSYASMAGDISALLDHLGIHQCIVVGHSMGGKVAMKLASTQPERVKQLVVMDMSPVAYQTHRHDNVFSGLQAVNERRPKSRKEAMVILQQHIEIDGVRQFLSKSMYTQDGVIVWGFNVDTLLEQYQDIVGWSQGQPYSKPTLFMKGADSDYISAEHQPQIKAQFPLAKAHIIANTGHWLHAEKPAEVLRAITKFLDKSK
ncbi:alpha/beta fold hydrolase [Vibrio astriarenae]|uniref:Alpha/beta fold hydrolase n=1 Tax=Vibrio astriarenae TaxID=1481923 RepID=A0A7Z2T3W9_9VIBR|nr:alpha/beta fold hydrolase [Vibrio astriarenae]QIA63913.1 alpha/beta fold hydrolase [Vibrio astriarenae]